MKYCMEYAALLDPYVDGELSGEETARVRSHLETCPGCRSYVDAALALRAAFPETEEAEVPEGFAEGVMAAVRELEAGKAKTRRLPWRQVLLPLAACFALAVLVHTAPGGGEERALMSAAPAAEDTASMEAPAADAGGEPGDAGAPQMASLRSGDGPAAAEEDLAAPESLEPPAAAPDGVPAEKNAVCTSLPASDEVLEEEPAVRAIRLTAEEAGDLLADLPYTTGEDGVRCYQLPEGDLEALLEALAERDVIPPETEAPEAEALPEGYALVYVTEE